MKEKMTQNFNIKSFIARSLSSTVKLAACAAAPMASTKIFAPDSDSVTNVVNEVAGNNGGKFISFLACGANVISNDVIDMVNWVSEIDLIEDVVELVTSFVGTDTKETSLVQNSVEFDTLGSDQNLDINVTNIEIDHAL